MSILLQQMLGFRTLSESKRYRRVLIAGQYVMLTVAQARRYEELMRLNARSLQWHL